MFESARVKLTAWYLVILMTISVFFSMLIYQIATSEVERIINRLQYRLNYPNENVIPETPSALKNHQRQMLLDLEESKRTLFYELLLINGIIAFVAGGAGYFLAGKTLQPIKKMVEEQDAFITNASHELRTPIATMRAEIEALLMEKNITPAQYKNLISSTHEEVLSLQDMTDNLLTFSHIQDNAIQMPFENISGKEVLARAQKKVHQLAKKKQILVYNDESDFIVKGNKQGLIQLFVIILENAIKYSQATTKIHIVSKESPNFISVAVQDQGCGIKSVDIPHIFKRFYRADKSRSQTEGYGLGLSIAKRIVEMHKGSIHVKSDEKKGTIVTVKLPKAR